MLLIAGKIHDTDYCRNIKKICEKNNRIILMDYVSEIEKVWLFLNASLLISTASSEGFGIPVLDAASLNLPVLASNISSHIEIKNLKIGVCEELVGDGISEEVNTHFSNTIEELKKLGAKIEYVSVPYIKESLPVYYLTAPSEASSNLNRYDGIKYGFSQNSYDNSCEVIKNTRSNFGEEVKRRIMVGTFAHS